MTRKIIDCRSELQAICDGEPRFRNLEARSVQTY